MSGDDDRIADCAVVGAGPVGLVTALGLASRGFKLVVVGEPALAAGDDLRTAALFAPSVALLKAVGVLDDIAATCEPLRAVRIVDDTGGLLRAPEVVFAAEDVGLAAFGLNVPNQPLTAALWARASRTDAIDMRVGRVAEVRWGDGVVVLTDGCGGQIRARLVVGADGRESVCRRAAGIEADTWRYDQAAITTRFAHSRPHRGISTEFQRKAGPCTTVPLPGLASSLVWVEAREEAARLARLDEDGFRGVLEQRLGGLLGSVGEIAPRHGFALGGLKARVMGRNRVALVGEAGHVMPPIGAQGLNLGLRDAGWLVDCARRGADRDGDPGSASVLEAYHAARVGDVGLRIGVVDALNRSLATDLLLVALARGLGLHVLAAVPVLKRQVIREGMAARGALPSLMADAMAVRG